MPQGGPKSTVTGGERPGTGNAWISTRVLHNTRYLIRQ
jgi:hypothetical protein